MEIQSLGDLEELSGVTETFQLHMNWFHKHIVLISANYLPIYINIVKHTGRQSAFLRNLRTYYCNVKSIPIIKLIKHFALYHCRTLLKSKTKPIPKTSGSCEKLHNAIYEFMPGPWLFWYYDATKEMPALWWGGKPTPCMTRLPRHR